MSPELMKKAPAGKFRVLCIDKFDDDAGVHGDYDTREEALTVARNETRRAAKDADDSSIATVFYAYDDQGRYLGGDIYANE